MLPDHFSVSQLTKFLTCPLSYRFQYVDQIKVGSKTSSFALGTAFHTAAEKLHKHMLNGGVRKPEVYRDALGDALSSSSGTSTCSSRTARAAIRWSRKVPSWLTSTVNTASARRTRSSPSSTGRT